MSLVDVWKGQIDTYMAGAAEGKRVEREFCVAWLRRAADNFVQSLPVEDRYSDEITDACEILIRDLADKIEAGRHV